MNEYEVPSLIFGSSAAVYGNSYPYGIEENTPLVPVTTYGVTKFTGERMAIENSTARNCGGTVILRYFNVVGADDCAIESNVGVVYCDDLVSRISRVAIGLEKCFDLYGTDYETKDGSCVRDFVHVSDVARANLAALYYSRQEKNVDIFNIGCATGHSVLDVIHNFENINNVRVPINSFSRRIGDVAECYSNNRKASEILGWNPVRSLSEMCTSALALVLCQRN